jgi:LysM repeat protein
VAAIRSRQAAPPAQVSEQIKIDAPVRRPQAVPSEPIPLYPASVQAEVEEPPPTLKEAQPVQQTSPIKRLAMFGAIFIVAAVGLVFVWSKFAAHDASKVSSVQVTTPPLRAATEDRRTASTAPSQPTQPPSAEIAIPAQNDNPSSGQAASPAEVSPAKDTPADVPTATPVPGSRYKVVRGDMLSDIARRAYKDASKFILIQKANPNLRNGPDRIYYDQEIYIPPVP